MDTYKDEIWSNS